MNRPSMLARWAGFFLSFALCACVDELDTERRGGPLPPGPPECEPSFGAGGEGGGVSVVVTYCQASRVMDEVCRRCHQDPPINGAPFSLMTYADTQELFGDTGKLRFERMREVIETSFMPPRPSKLDPPAVLSCEQRKTLLAWLEQCAKPEGGTDCENTDAALLSCD
jgi:hypothetical protein